MENTINGAQLENGMTVSRLDPEHKTFAWHKIWAVSHSENQVIYTGTFANGETFRESFPIGDEWVTLPYIKVEPPLSKEDNEKYDRVYRIIMGAISDSCRPGASDAEVSSEAARRILGLL